MTIKIEKLPNSEKPYERLELYGAKMLSNSELLAIIIKNGTREDSCIDLAKKVLSLSKNINSDNLNFLNDLSIDELMKVKGIGKVKAIQLKAVCEIAKRINSPIEKINVQVTKSDDIAELLMNELRYEKREIVKVVILNNKNMILRIIDISLGANNSAYINPKDVFSEAIKISAPRIILVHNHPSGDPTPSKADFELTKKVEEVGSLLGIELLDHIVIGNGIYESIFFKRRCIK